MNVSIPLDKQDTFADALISKLFSACVYTAKDFTFYFSATVRASQHTQSTTTSPHSTPHHHRKHTHHSNITSSEMTSSPLLRSTGQTIARLSSDDGSSDEDNTVTKQGYINANPNRQDHTSTGGNGDQVLVDSTLSAIQNGRIKTDSSSHRGMELSHDYNNYEILTQSVPAAHLLTYRST